MQSMGEAHRPPRGLIDMSTHELLDPAIRPVIDAFPQVELTVDILPVARQVRNEALVLADAEAAGVDRQEIEVPAVEPGQPAGRARRP